MSYLEHPDQYQPSWKNRRRTIFAALFICLFVVLLSMSVASYLAMGWKLPIIEATFFGSMITTAFGAGAWIIRSYVFGAIADDKNLMGFLSTRKPGN